MGTWNCNGYRFADFLQDHIDNLENFVLALDLSDIMLVMQDFGGPVGMGLAIRHPERIKRIISINGPNPLGQHDLIDRITANVAVSPWFQWRALFLSSQIG